MASRSPLRFGRAQARWRLLVVAVTLSAAAVIAAQQPRPQMTRPEQRLEEAKRLLEVQGNFAEAARQFKQLSEDPDRLVAATALVYLGMCYDRQGLANAADAWRMVIQKYPDQEGPVQQATERLAALERARSDAPGTADLRNAWPLQSRPGGVICQASDGAQWFGSFVYGGTEISIGDMSNGREVRRLNARREDDDKGGVAGCAVSPDGSEVALTWQAPDRPLEIRIASGRQRQPRVLLTLEEDQYAFLWNWSPAGSILASIDRNGEPSVLSAISVADGRVRGLARRPAMPKTARLSPDGRFACFDGPVADEPRSTLYLASPSGGTPVPLLSDRFDNSAPVWSPDGTFLLFVSNRSGFDSLCLLPVADGKASGKAQVLSESLGRIATALGLTKDGRYFYFKQVGLTEVYTLALDDEARPAAEPHSVHVGDKMQPGFGLSNGRLVLALAPTLGGVMVLHDLERDTETKIDTGMGFFRSPRWSADGRSILVKGEDAQNWNGPHLIDVETGRVSALDVPGGAEGQWDPQSGDILFTAQVQPDTTAIRRWRIGAQGSDPVATLEPKERPAQIAPSPADGSLLLRFRERDTSFLMLRAPDGTRRELFRVARPDYIDDVAWMPDGRRLLVVRASPQKRRSQLWHVTVATGRAEPLNVVMDGLRDLAVSPDGRLAAFVAGGPRREIWVLSNFLPPARHLGPAKRQPDR